MIANTIQKSTRYFNPSSLVSKREIEVLHLISEGLSSHQIALQLYIGIETVKSHRRNLLSKMNATNSASLVRSAFESGLLKISASQVNSN